MALTASIAGRWHLIAADCPDDHIPDHRVDLVFHDGPDGLRGAILSRVDGQEMPLHSVALTGPELRLKMSAPPGLPDVDLPCLVMHSLDGCFEGAWDRVGTEHLQLKLVRARTE